jgi:hypothetical protein
MRLQRNGKSNCSQVQLSMNKLIPKCHNNWKNQSDRNFLRYPMQKVGHSRIRQIEVRSKVL